LIFLNFNVETADPLIVKLDRVTLLAADSDRRGQAIEAFAPVGAIQYSQRHVSHKLPHLESEREAQHTSRTRRGDEISLKKNVRRRLALRSFLRCSANTILQYNEAVGNCACSHDEYAVFFPSASHNQIRFSA
jgi:hypothetical protein